MVKRRRMNSARNNRTDRSPAKEDELVTARDRFKGALQDLIPHSEDDSDSGSDDDNWTKSKKQQKKKAASEKAAEDKSQQPFVMKLFDRSVDLAQFTENTPMYVISRAWMANQPHQTYSITVPPPKRARSPVIKEEPQSPPREEDPVKDTYSLPPPIEDSDKGYVNVRIPQLVERNTEYKELFQDEPSTKVLLAENQSYWLKVRKSWHNASKKNEERYSNSIKTLVAIFEKAQRQQSP